MKIVDKIYTVSEVTYYIEALIDQDQYLSDIQVVGEIADLKERNGHLFFYLKDEFTTIGCVFFGGAYRSFGLSDGRIAQVAGQIKVYAPRGQYRLICRQAKILPERGTLFLRMKESYERLVAEGIFDKPKRPLPEYPSKIGLITSRNSAAYQDVLRTISDRYPLVEIFLYHTGVQGEDAKGSLLRALNDVNESDVDVVIITRGGGSRDDLWLFNDEDIVRAVYKLRHPVITGVGHQIDTVFIDLVADYSAHTPTAAAQAAVPNLSEIRMHFLELMQRMNLSIRKKIESFSQQIESSNKSLFQSMMSQILRTHSSIDSMKEKAFALMQRQMFSYEKKLSSAGTKLFSLNPVELLKKGYVIVEKDGKWVKSSSILREKDEISMRFFDGVAKVVVK